MIDLDFSLTITLYLSIYLFLIMFFWLKEKKQKEKKLFLNPKFIWFCCVCTYTYVNTKEEFFSICPRCGSYNKK